MNIRCCTSQKMILTGKTVGGEDRLVCAYCGTVLTKTTTKKDPIILCGDRDLINLQRANGFNDMADRQEAFLASFKERI